VTEVADSPLDYTALLPLGPDTTEYRVVTTDGIDTVDPPLGSFLRVSRTRSAG
jgi:fumarate hydratase class I